MTTRIRIREMVTRLAGMLAKVMTSECAVRYIKLISR
jgi:hypothetical protein